VPKGRLRGGCKLALCFSVLGLVYYCLVVELRGGWGRALTKMTPFLRARQHVGVGSSFDNIRIGATKP